MASCCAAAQDWALLQKRRKREKRERKAFHKMSTELSKGYTEWMKVRETLKTNRLLTLLGRACVWSRSGAKMHACLQRHVFSLLHKCSQSSQPLSTLPEGAQVAVAVTSRVKILKSQMLWKYRTELCFRCIVFLKRQYILFEIMLH